MSRVLALVVKDLLEVRQQPGIFLPAFITGAMAVVLPFFIALGIPLLTGERLGDSGDFRKAADDVARVVPAIAALTPEGRVQATLFQQFVILLVLIPVTGSMAVASYSVIGEKQARTLEPLLATPIRTSELLAAKVLAALLPALALSLATSVLYLAGIGLLAAPGVFVAVLSARTLITLLLIGPLCACAGLLLAVIASSRATDPRSAQQVGVVVVLPITALLVAQMTGTIVMSVAVALGAVAALVALDLALLAIGVRLFDREAILTRWK